MESMRSHAQIVSDAGKTEAIAIRLGISVHTVRSWVQRNSIPPAHWAGFAEAGWTTLSELADAKRADIAA